MYVIGNPENRRITLFQQALQSTGRSSAKVISYLELLSSSDWADRLLPGIPLRIDSPGENFEVERCLLAAGASAAMSEGSPFIDQDEVSELTFDKGLILFPRQWFLGYQQTLLRIQKSFLIESQRPTMNWPEDIAAMFDKRECHKQLGDVDIPVARCLPKVQDYDDLRAKMWQMEMDRVFIKLAHGSSASGVVAFRVRGDRLQAITSAELVLDGAQVRLYNSLKLRIYTQANEIALVVNELCRHGVHVEEWIPKASRQDMQFDLRIVVIGGEPCHAVVRMSRSPLTNLHLGNQRGDLDELRKEIPQQWESILSTCRRVMDVYPRSLYAGVDIALTADRKSHVVLESNAFGDLLPGITHMGKDTYQAEIDAFGE